MTERPPVRHRWRRATPSPAMAVAFGALILAGPPVAVAARMITGGQIQNGSITGKDLKDGSVGPSDLSRSARDALAGERGPAGAAGATGASGPVGPQGPQGFQGARGPIGPNGADGKNGRDGADGQDGDDGQDAIALWARVDAGDSPAAAALRSAGASQASSVQVVGSGRDRFYRLTFDRDVSGCAAAVTRRSSVASADPDALLRDADAEAAGAAYTFASPGSNELSVRLLDLSGAGTTGSFSVLLRCPDAAPPQ